jgi:hypothetical protein
VSILIDKRIIFGKVGRSGQKTVQISFMASPEMLPDTLQLCRLLTEHTLEENGIPAEAVSETPVVGRVAEDTYTIFYKVLDEEWFTDQLRLLLQIPDAVKDVLGDQFDNTASRG